MRFSDLGRKSIRRNALIADLLYRIEFIEKAGTGIKRIRDEARNQGCPEPTFESMGFLAATFFPNPAVRTQGVARGERVAAEAGAHDEAHERAQDETREPMMEVDRELLMACAQEPRSTAELLRALGYKTRTGDFKRALSSLVSRGFLEMNLPDKPRTKK